MVSQAIQSHEGRDGSVPWLGFASGLWTREINLRDFIQQNVTPYYGDDTFLAGTDQTHPGALGEAAGAFHRGTQERRSRRLADPQFDHRA